MKRLLRSSPPVSIDQPCTTQFRVIPTDLDINFHMNNGVYLSLMDLGRLDLMIKSGIFWKLFKNGYYPLVVSQGIRFKKSLELFQRFEMVTQINSLDEKDFFITQKFFHRGQLCAEGVIRGRFKKRGRSGSIPSKELFAFLGLEQHFTKTALADQLVALTELLAQK
jgi:acyl-CoA thioesterase FadM